MINPDAMKFRFDGINQMRGAYNLSGSEFCDASPESQHQAMEFLKRQIMLYAYGDAQAAFRELYSSLVFLQALGQPVVDHGVVKAALEKLSSAIAMH